MPRQHYSLKRRLILYTSLFSLILGAISLFTSYRIALNEINEILDAQMVYLAQRVSLNLRPMRSHYDENKHYREQDLLVDVWAYGDRDLHHTTDGQNLLLAAQRQAGFYWHESANEQWISYIIPTAEYQIQISQQVETRQNLAWRLAGSMLLPYLMIFPLALLGMVWIVRRNFRPLDDFKMDLAQRSSNDLEPIQDQHYPQELLPTIQEMNYLFARISSAQQEQRQFIADAAHELRTPITALNLQIQILLNENADHHNLDKLSQGLARIQHLVSQLLLLAKQDAAFDLLAQCSDFKVNGVVLQCMEQLIHLAMQKDIDMGWTQNQDVMLHSVEYSVHSIVYNLLDNAIKYTPQAGIINIAVGPGPESVARIVIEDSGPGLPEALYEKVLKRFYRVHHHVAVGSGLGLAIVDAAIQQLGGRLELGRSGELGGLRVQVDLPMLDQSVPNSSSSNPTA
ncbi:ATP-binding protein [Acinetobacter larvae]|uniref:histidine kinase n=1 Tax=Acinetobacter larvae TaxID=1789224 RepID=A0A1B2M1M7_9GAMM|nr:ATP-binding protein [Acinetobacter larvae]AOA59069.1 two-component sensor histidine kinase [Acinetobacter larvae]